MITLVKGQPVPESDYIVKEDGTYNEGDLVLCENSTGIEAAFQAYFIVNGKCVGE